jgi:flagellar FliL protein
MSTNPEAAAPEPAPKKKRRGKKILFTLTALLVIGGGAGGGLYAMGINPLASHGEAEDPDMPHLVVREGVSADVADAARHRARRGRPDPRVFQATYYPLANNFTSNLRGGQAFVQIGLGVSTYYDERVIENLRTHDMAVRSAVLMTLTEQDPVEITTFQGKQRLKIALRNAINEALTIREGFGGIDDVYFTSFVTQ